MLAIASNLCAPATPELAFGRSSCLRAIVRPMPAKTEMLHYFVGPLARISSIQPNGLARRSAPRTSRPCRLLRHPRQQVSMHL